MLLAWFHWWWDPGLGLSRAEVVVGVVGGILALIALWYARRVASEQLKLMKGQDGLMNTQLELIKEQTEADKRVATLTAELHAILSKQSEISELQLQLVKHQLYARAHFKFYPESDGKRVSVTVTNVGESPISKVDWQLSVEGDQEEDIEVRELNLTQMPENPDEAYCRSFVIKPMTRPHDWDYVLVPSVDFEWSDTYGMAPGEKRRLVSIKVEKKRAQRYVWWHATVHYELFTRKYWGEFGM
jgi:hypothetical protein